MRNEFILLSANGFAECCEDFSGRSRFVKGGKFLEQLNDS